MATGETGLKSRILEIVRSTKAQKEPLTTGSEYAGTKKVIQSYEEQKKYLLDRLKDAEDELEACKSVPRRYEIVKEGYNVKGYGLLIPLRDDVDIEREMALIAESMMGTYSLGLYLGSPGHHGQIVLHPYPATELSLWFPEPLHYNLANEAEKAQRSFRAAYGVQVYAGAVRSVEQAIAWEENASMIVGNEEMAERLKESDVTLLVGMAAAQQDDAEGRRPVKLPSEPGKAEIAQALRDLAAEELEIKTPSSIPGGLPFEQAEPLTGIDTVNVGQSPRKKIKRKEAARQKAKPKKKPSGESET